jgi:CRP/FNR family transcriptional regulator
MRAVFIDIKPVEERVPSQRRHAASCSSCNMRQLCLPGGLDAEDLARIDNMVYARRRLERGEALYHAGAQFSAVHAIRSGSFRTSLFDAERREQIIGFFMGGEDSEVCVLSVGLIERLTRAIPALQRRLHSLLAREILREQQMMMLLGHMRAERRLATFLLNLSARSVRRGYSSSDFHLRMTREEMGSYLGLKLETVSRLFRQFHDAALIEVDYKHVRILDVPGLQRLVNDHAATV